MTKPTISILALIIIALLGVAVYVSQFHALPQSAYSLFTKVPSPKQADRILIVSPHQDDETLGAGGYLELATQAKATVEVIFATDGNKHGLKNERNAEALKALEKLNIKNLAVKFYNYPDGKLTNNQPSFQKELATDIAAFKPTVVVTTLPEDTHPDHATAGRAVKSIWEKGKSFQLYFFLIHYHRYPRPINDDNQEAYLLPPLELINGDYNWSVLPLSTHQQSVKLSAILEYKSQLSIKNPILRQLLLAFDQKNELFATIR